MGKKKATKSAQPSGSHQQQSTSGALPQPSGSHQRQSTSGALPQPSGSHQQQSTSGALPQPSGSHQRQSTSGALPQPSGSHQRQSTSGALPQPSRSHQQQSTSGALPQPNAKRAKETKSPQQLSGPSGDHEKDKKSKEKESSEEKYLIAYPARIYEKTPNNSEHKIKVITNYFPLIIDDQNIIVYHYDVTFNPDKPNYLIRPVWNKFSREQFGKRITLFDGKKNAYSRGPLIENSTHSAKVTILNPENDKTKEFNVEIKQVREVNFSVLRNYKNVFNIEGKLPEAEIAILDIVLKNWPANNLIQSNRTFFPKMEKLNRVDNLSDRLHIRTGYYQSAVLCYKPYLNFDISFKPFYRNCKVEEILENFKRFRTNDLDITGFNSFLRGAKIIYEIPNKPESRRCYRVNKLVASADSQKFKKEDGSSITVAEYFNKEKKYKLKFPNLPLLWVGSTQKTIYVPLECCTIAPDQVYKGEMDPRETRAMVQKATLNAKDRKSQVEYIFRQAELKNEYLREFGITVLDKMITVDARVLNPPLLKTRGTIRVDKGVWKINDFYEPTTLSKWCLLNLDQRARKEDLDKFQNLIKSKGMYFKMNIGGPAMNPISGDSRPMGLKKSLSDLKNMDLVFVIIPDSKDLYSRVKKICETEEGILTQCIKSRTLQQDFKKISTTIENILLKVNAKLGGKNHCLDNNSVPSSLKGYIMIIGADVTHPGPGSKIPSVAAVAVSCDASSFQYEISYRVQKGEIIQDMENIIKQHLEKFYRIRQHYPDKIIFFRDGVSEGELSKVFHFELRAIKSACREKCNPKITVVVVQKRHHTRLYPTCDRDADRNYNVPVGTCVDTEIVHPKSLDFYLLSHMSILGTARPTRYRLIHDDNKFTDAQIEELSYYLCHLYPRCNRSVSYPTPTYNAHLAAYRVRSYLDTINCSTMDLTEIQRNIKDRISNKFPMFFV